MPQFLFQQKRYSKALTMPRWVWPITKLKIRLQVILKYFLELHESLQYSKLQIDF